MVIIALSLAVAVPASAQATVVRASLDTGQLEFGLANDPAGSTATDLNWMTASGVPWKYRYHYLSGGSGSSNSAWWTGSTWARDYMTASTTNPANYMPVMSYYMMCQAVPQSPGCGFPNDGVQDYNILQNASSMSAYYADFRTLLQQAGSYGKPVIIHVEPDLWGLMQQKAVTLGQTTAAGVPAKVKTSGFSDVHVNFSSFNDDFQSFACSLLMLRDAYAPNALMAIHASPWSAGPDIASDTSSLSEKTLADATAVFLNSSCLSSNPFGGSTWDLVFNDVDDHDAAWWELNGITNSGFTHWWDPTNTVFPNFTRYLSWVSELKVKTARPQIVWQVPMGNQYFETEDNSAGHLQDTVAQYFVTHPDALYSAGLIAVLFGAGNGGQTTYADSNGDGITNGPGHGTLDPATVAWCSACNTHVSTSSDDDGGFVRIFVGQYYATHHVGRQPVAQSTAGGPPGRGPVAQSGPYTSPRPRAPAGPAASRSTRPDVASVDGHVGQWYLYGANMPWLNWGSDFGGASGNVSSNLSELDTKLAAAQSAGMHMVRWWVFEGSSPQILRDGGGVPTGLKPAVYTDIDAALAEAAKYGISYDFVLFGSTDDDSVTHQWWENATDRAALVTVLTPLFVHYASNPRVHTWEIVNEPEWQSRNGITSVAGMLATVDALATAVHATSKALVTVGNAQMQDMATWVGHPLDYYSPHYYDGFGTGANDPFVTTAAVASPDGKPVVIGEFEDFAGLSPTAQQRLQDLYNNGYAGAWPWSLSPEHTSDAFAVDLGSAAAFASGKTDLGPVPSGRQAAGQSQPGSAPARSPAAQSSPGAPGNPRVPEASSPSPTADQGQYTTAMALSLSVIIQLFLHFRFILR